MPAIEYDDTKPTFSPVASQDNVDKVHPIRAETAPVIDSRISRTLKLKADIILLPTLAIAYLLKFVYILDTLLYGKLLI